VNGRRGPGYLLENAAVHPVINASVLPDGGERFGDAMRALPFLANCVVVSRDRTRGTIELDRDGGARLRYPVSREDLERLRHGLASAARAYLAAGAAEVFLPLHGYGPLRGEGDLARLAEFPLEPSRLTLLYAVHLFGGATMGARAQSSFCRPDGACWDVRGLYVCDASTLPSNTGVNPQITIMANALRVAEGIAGGRA
jgi:choline dehydrogenase-like flavoprotein